MAWLGLGKTGFLNLYRMERERQSSLLQIQQLAQENQALLDEINRLRTDPEYIESVAKRELGLIKRNEVIYRFSQEKKPAEKGPQKAGPADEGTHKEEVR